MKKTRGVELQVVLVNPEIPQNTGNIARTCACVGASLHLIEPLGFSIEDRYLRRAGLDYWHLLDVHIHSDLQTYYDTFPEFQRYYATKKTGTIHSHVSFDAACSIILGNETTGLPEYILRENRDRCIRIPIKEGLRSLNLSNAAAILVFEILRQHGFPGLSADGPGLADPPQL